MLGQVRPCTFNPNLTCRRIKNPCPLQVSGFVEGFAFYLFDGRTPKAVALGVIGASSRTDLGLATKADFNLNFQSERDRDLTIKFFCEGSRFSGGRVMMNFKTCEAFHRTFKAWNNSRLGFSRRRDKV